MNTERIYFIMKNFIFISACLLSLMVNAQARLNIPAKDIYDEFELENIKYINDSEVGLYLTFYPDANVLVNYYLDVDSICTSVTIQTFTKETTNFIINNYTIKGYLKTDTGWLMRSDYGIFKITHVIEEDGSNIFFWY
jgi:hypothetical protein